MNATAFDTLAAACELEAACHATPLARRSPDPGLRDSQLRDLRDAGRAGVRDGGAPG